MSEFVYDANMLREIAKLLFKKIERDPDPLHYYRISEGEQKWTIKQCGAQLKVYRKHTIATREHLFTYSAGVLDLGIQYDPESCHHLLIALRKDMVLETLSDV